MIRVWRVSGEELATIPAEELSDVVSLQRQLRAKHGMPVSLQNLLHDGRKLSEQDKIGVPLELQLILATCVQGTERKAAQELHEAASAGEVEVVRLLLRSGVDKDFTDSSTGSTALISASGNGHVEVVRMLLQGGAAKDVANRFGNTALINASGNGHAEVARLLLESGAAKDLTNLVGNTALIGASEPRGRK